jgi:hypothetical protein
MPRKLELLGLKTYQHIFDEEKKERRVQRRLLVLAWNGVLWNGICGVS